MDDYFGITAQQKKGAVEIIRNFLEKEQPSNILEIGTGHGALSLLIRHTCPQAKFVTVDITYYLEHDLLYLAGIIPAYWDIHDRHAKAFFQFANLFIQAKGKTIVFCDNGKKVDEFNLLAQFLKSGDIILAHDFAPDREKRVWEFAPEICDEDIRDSCLRYGLCDYKEDIFEPYAWVCKRRV